MNDPYLKKVLVLAGEPRPIEAPTAIHWQNLERDLGLTLPQDLKTLVTSLGNGGFGEFSLLNPCSSSKYTEFSYQEAMWYYQHEEWVIREAGFRLYPDPNGLLRIGIAGNRMDLLLDLPRQEEGNYKLIWLDQDYRRGHSIDLTLSHFLHDLYLGQIPEDWAVETKSLLWEEDEPFFTSRKGQQP